MFEGLPDHPMARGYLEKALLSGKIPQALLFAGPPGVGKEEYALRFAAALLGTEVSRLTERKHPDFFSVAPEGKGAVIAIDALRQVQPEAYKAPFEAKKKVFFLADADRMQAEAANALLKTLEEPGPFAYFFLLTSRPGDLLPTVRSRLAKLFFPPLAQKEREDPLQKELFSWLQEPALPAHLRLQKIEAIEALLSEDPGEKGTQIERILALILMWFRDQHARQISEEIPLFFPDEPPSSAWLSLEDIENKIFAIQNGIERNLKFSVLLEKLLKT